MKDKKFIDKLQIAECWFSLGALQAGTPLGKKFLDPADYNIYIYIVFEPLHNILALAICSGKKISLIGSFIFLSSEFR